MVTLDEWYNHFDEIARRDSDCKDNDVATSVDVAEQLTFLETQAGLLPQSKVLLITTKAKQTPLTD